MCALAKASPVQASNILSSMQRSSEGMKVQKTAKTAQLEIPSCCAVRGACVAVALRCVGGAAGGDVAPQVPRREEHKFAPPSDEISFSLTA